MKKIIYSLMVLAMAAFTFSSCEDVPAPYDLPNNPETPDNPGVATGTGTADDPFNSIAAIAYCQSLEAGVESENEVYIKGKVQSIKEEFGSYGNGSFYIADDENSTKFYVYRALFLGNKKWTSSDDQIKVGDEVVVCGKVVNYSGNTPETVQNKAYLVSLNGKTAGGDTPAAGEAKGTGTKEDPFNSIAAINYVKSLGADVTSENDVYIKGKIREIKEQYSAQYGNTSVTIADDATSEVFTIWRALYFNNQKWAEGNDELKEGDEVVFCGKVVNYKGNTPETVQGQAYLVSLNGKTSGGGSVDPTPTPTPSEGLVIDGTNVTMTNAKATIAEGESVKIDLNTVGLTDGQSNPTITANGVTITFDANGQEQKPTFKNGTKGVRVYANNKIVITGANNIAKIVFTCDSYNSTTYVGNNTATITFDGKTATYVNTWPQPGGTQLRVQTVEIFYAK